MYLPMFVSFIFFTFVWYLPKLYISLISVLKKLMECSLERHANFTNMKQIDNSEKSRFFSQFKSRLTRGHWKFHKALPHVVT